MMISGFAVFARIAFLISLMFSAPLFEKKKRLFNNFTGEIIVIDNLETMVTLWIIN